MGRRKKEQEQSQPEANLDVLLQKLKKQYSEPFKERVIPTGYFLIDYGVFGVGGIPLGSLIELYSREGCGKTTLALHFSKAFLDTDGITIYVDTENGFSVYRANTLGVNINSPKFILIKNIYLEDIIKDIKEIVWKIREVEEGRDTPILIVWDSIAGTQLKEEEKGLGYVARQLAWNLRGISYFLMKNMATLLCINHYRANIMEGELYTTGGLALKYLSQIRVAMRFSQKLDNNQGFFVSLWAEKNKHFPPHHKLQMLLNYNTGFDIKYDVIWSNIILNLIQKSDGWLKFGDKSYRYSDNELFELAKNMLKDIREKNSLNSREIGFKILEGLQSIATQKKNE